MTTLQRLTAGAGLVTALLAVPVTPAAAEVSVVIRSGGAYAGQHQRRYKRPHAAHRKHAGGHGPSHRKHQFGSHPRTFQQPPYGGRPHAYGQPRHGGHPRAYKQPPLGSHPRTFNHDRHGAYPRYRFGATPPSMHRYGFQSHPQKRFRAYDRFPYSTAPRRGHRPHRGPATRYRRH